MRDARAAEISTGASVAIVRYVGSLTVDTLRDLCDNEPQIRVHLILGGGVRIPELLAQVGKISELCAPWGVTPREVDKLIEGGAVRPARPAGGKGSLRLLDEWSLCDVFFAHACKELGVRQETVAKVVARLRPEYPRLLGQRPQRLRVHFAPRNGRRATRIWPELVFDTRLLWSCLATAILAKDELTQVQRGRPKKDWRALFSKAMNALSKEMQAKRISDEQIDAAIERVRARRRQAKADEAVVTIPAP